MIVQPAPLDPRSGPRRAVRVLGLVVPVVLLTVIVGIGLAGPALVPAPSPAIAVNPAPSARSSAAATEESSPVYHAVSGLEPVFPSSVAGLVVHGVPWTLEARSRGLARGLIAVAGYLGENTVPAGCSGGKLRVFGPTCERTAVLAETRVAWVNGEEYPTFPTVDPLAIDRQTAADLKFEEGIAEAAMGPGAYPLLTAYVLPAMLAQIDPEAARGLPADRPVWYVRGLHREGEPGQIDWLVKDPVTERIVARGTVRTGGSPSDAGDRGAPTPTPGS